ncbi:hypothetical protein, variant [Aphanomyces invadans]|uniref:Uncharacterized protein n=1 Tax=Aphanomyces invadans TaxID=157072 RepID=A0A024UL20_9STRA|nr:hypothetical protein, variant [Aphanomyces invadans]ETW06313.1 hypothetical protein, variant [Aphanomyces invadans]|eukprot:XP_008864388.1 hypothetical protein, variant [Aphanomyces invadans]
METKPSLRTMASNVQACLDEMLPDHFRNAASGSFQQHLVAQKEKVPAQKATWKGGLNYLFESLKMHREWYGRNQQYVQLKKEEKRLEAHVVTLRSIISSSLSTLELEVGLREAELKGRVGAYKVMFEVSRVASALSRPTVKLHVHKPDDSSISVFCDTFVLDIHLTGGNGDVHSASLTTVVNEVTKQYPERDADLLSCLLELISGRSERFTEKLRRLVNRAELAAKFPSTNFDDLEDDLQEKLQLVCAKQNLWTVRRGVDGLLLTFRDGLQCFPLLDGDGALSPPRKKAKHVDEADGTGDDAAAPTVTSAPWTEWQGCLTFAEWKGAVALHFVCDTPLVMSGIQSRRLASTIFGIDDQEMAFNELVQDIVGQHNTGATHSVVRFQPQLRFVRDASTNVILHRALPVVLDGSLVTKEIVGGIQFAAFPIPVRAGGERGRVLPLSSCFEARATCSGKSWQSWATACFSIQSWRAFLQAARRETCLGGAIRPPTTWRRFQPTCKSKSKCPRQRRSHSSSQAMPCRAMHSWK